MQFMWFKKQCNCAETESDKYFEWCLKVYLKLCPSGHYSASFFFYVEIG